MAFNEMILEASLASYNGDWHGSTSLTSYPRLNAAQNGFSAASYNQPASMFSGAPQPKEEESDFIK